MRQRLSLAVKRQLSIYHRFSYFGKFDGDDNKCKENTQQNKQKNKQNEWVSETEILKKSII